MVEQQKVAYITGATGCVGRNLVDELLDEGWKVITLVRKSSQLSRLHRIDEVEVRVVDLHRIESVRDVLHAADAIFHVAGNMSYWKPERHTQWRDNVLATRNLARVALEKGIAKFIFTSTGAVWTESSDNRCEAMQMEYSYSRTKRLAELEVLDEAKNGLNACIVQLPIVMGRYDQNGYSQIFGIIKSGKIGYAFPGEFRFSHAGDVAKAHMAAYHRGVSGKYYYIAGLKATWQEVFQKIADRVGSSAQIKVAPKWWLVIASHLLVAVSFFTKKRPMFTPDLIRLLDKDRNNINPSELDETYERQKVIDDLDWSPVKTIDDMVNDCADWLDEGPH